jgi:hypothetical protein
VLCFVFVLAFVLVRVRHRTRFAAFVFELALVGVVSVFVLGYESGIAFVVRGSWFVVWGPVFVLSCDRDCDCAAKLCF